MAKKKTYYIPTIEIAKLNTERIMALADSSNVAELAPPRREKAF